MKRTHNFIYMLLGAILVATTAMAQQNREQAVDQASGDRLLTEISAVRAQLDIASKRPTLQRGGGAGIGHKPPVQGPMAPAAREGGAGIGHKPGDQLPAPIQLPTDPTASERETVQPRLLDPSEYRRRPGEAAAYAASFCVSRIGLLESAYRAFEREYWRGNAEGAFVLFRRGLDAAIRGDGTSPAPTDGPFSVLQRSLERGVELLETADQAFYLETDLDKRERLKRELIQKYVSFIVHKVVPLESLTLLPFMLEYRLGRCSDCNPADRESYPKRWNEFEDKFAAYAKAQVEWVQTFAKYNAVDGVVPFGTAELYLRLVNKVAGYAADDLTATAVFLGAVGCASSELTQIANDTRMCNPAMPVLSCVEPSSSVNAFRGNELAMHQIWHQIQQLVLPHMTVQFVRRFYSSCTFNGADAPGSIR
ncbi:MAG TPA: hypothetical protein VM598_13770 [Bdellovibrionota bacterium]|nr:hypothetical protein [Bdellovibrionota bacterium]